MKKAKSIYYKPYYFFALTFLFVFPCKSMEDGIFDVNKEYLAGKFAFNNVMPEQLPLEKPILRDQVQSQEAGMSLMDRLYYENIYLKQQNSKLTVTLSKCKEILLKDNPPKKDASTQVTEADLASQGNEKLETYEEMYNKDPQSSHLVVNQAYKALMNSALNKRKAQDALSLCVPRYKIKHFFAQYADQQATTVASEQFVESNGITYSPQMPHYDSDSQLENIYKEIYDNDPILSNNLEANIFDIASEECFANGFVSDAEMTQFFLEYPVDQSMPVQVQDSLQQPTQNDFDFPKDSASKDSNSDEEERIYKKLCDQDPLLKSQLMQKAYKILINTELHSNKNYSILRQLRIGQDVYNLCRGNSKRFYVEHAAQVSKKIRREMKDK
jgi:hypothetical protein